MTKKSHIAVLAATLSLALVLVVGCLEEPTGRPPAPGLPPLARGRLDVYGDPLPEGVIARMGTTRLKERRDKMRFSPAGSVLARF